MSLTPKESPDPLEQIGTRIREARLAAKLSLREVGRRADVTASFLSQVERNQVQPSILSLRRICEVLGMSMLDALAPGDHRSDGKVVVTRVDQRTQMIPPTRDVAVDMLVSAPGRPFELLLVKLAPGRSTAPDLVAHHAKEAMTVITGRARFESESFVTELEAGDTVYLNADHPHRMINIGDDELTFIDVVVGEL